MTPQVVPAGRWRRQVWRPAPRIGPTSEWWVHHGAAGTPDLATLRSYERYHVATLGWRAPGYNWAITGDGTVYELRGWFAEGAHTSGRNRVSHAVLLVGDWTRGRVPDPMVESLAWLTREGARVGALVRPQISGGHREAPGQSTTCPGAAGMDAIDRARRLLTPPAPAPSVSASLLEEIAAMTPAERKQLIEEIAAGTVEALEHLSIPVNVSPAPDGGPIRLPQAVARAADNAARARDYAQAAAEGMPVDDVRRARQVAEMLARELIAALRRQAGMDPDPVSDGYWVDWLVDGERSMAQLRARFGLD